jgi:phosphatidate cytidylyltransferase
MLRTRILAAVPIVLVLCGALYLDASRESGTAFTVLLVLFTVLALREFYRLAAGSGVPPYGLFGIVTGALLVLAHERFLWEEWHGLEPLLPGGLGLLLAAGVLGPFLLHGRSGRPSGATTAIALTVLGLLYVWFLASFLPKMRHLGLVHGWGTDGVEFVLVCILGAKASDIGGFLVGRRFGRRRITPVLSPKKTWEGTLGGVGLSVLALLVMAALAPTAAIRGLGWAGVVGLGLLLGISAFFGDLAESLLKRDGEVKDAGGSVPGFGGILDLVDSLFVAAPVMYGYLLLMGARPGWTP